MKKIIWIILAIFLLVGIIGFYGVKKWHYNQQELTAYITVMGFNTIEECDKYLAYAEKLDITLETEVRYL